MARFDRNSQKGQLRSVASLPSSRNVTMAQFHMNWLVVCLSLFQSVHSGCFAPSMAARFVFSLDPELNVVPARLGDEVLVTFHSVKSSPTPPTLEDLQRTRLLYTTRIKNNPKVLNYYAQLSFPAQKKLEQRLQANGMHPSTALQQDMRYDDRVPLFRPTKHGYIARACRSFYGLSCSEADLSRTIVLRLMDKDLGLLDLSKTKVEFLSDGQWRVRTTVRLPLLISQLKSEFFEAQVVLVDTKSVCGSYHLIGRSAEIFQASERPASSNVVLRTSQREENGIAEEAENIVPDRDLEPSDLVREDDEEANIIFSRRTAETRRIAQSDRFQPQARIEEDSFMQEEFNEEADPEMTTADEESIDQVAEEQAPIEFDEEGDRKAITADEQSIDQVAEEEEEPIDFDEEADQGEDRKHAVMVNVADEQSTDQVAEQEQEPIEFDEGYVEIMVTEATQMVADTQLENSQESEIEAGHEVEPAVQAQQQERAFGAKIEQQLHEVGFAVVDGPETFELQFQFPTDLPLSYTDAPFLEKKSSDHDPLRSESQSDVKVWYTAYIPLTDSHARAQLAIRQNAGEYIVRVSATARTRNRLLYLNMNIRNPSPFLPSFILSRRTKGSVEVDRRTKVVRIIFPQLGEPKESSLIPLYTEQDLIEYGAKLESKCCICQDEMTLGMRGPWSVAKMPSCIHTGHRCCLRIALDFQDECPICRLKQGFFERSRSSSLHVASSRSDDAEI